MLWSTCGQTTLKTSICGMCVGMGIKYKVCKRHIIDDRQMYKPKEEVHIRGYLRETFLDPENGANNGFSFVLINKSGLM